MIDAIDVINTCVYGGTTKVLPILIFDSIYWNQCFNIQIITLCLLNTNGFNGAYSLSSVVGVSTSLFEYA